MPTVFLSLADIDAKIHAYEERYHLDSMAMLKDKDARRRIGEDVILQWEAYVQQRLYLRELHYQTHRDYLSRLNQGSRPRTRSKPKAKGKNGRGSDDLKYAA